MFQTLSYNVAQISVNLNIENLDKDQLRVFQVKEQSWVKVTDYLEGNDLLLIRKYSNTPIAELEVVDGVLYQIMETSRKSVYQLVTADALKICCS